MKIYMNKKQKKKKKKKKKTPRLGSEVARGDIWYCATSDQIVNSKQLIQ